MNIDDLGRDAGRAARQAAHATDPQSPPSDHRRWRPLAAVLSGVAVIALIGGVTFLFTSSSEPIADEPPSTSTHQVTTTVSVTPDEPTSTTASSSTSMSPPSPVDGGAVTIVGSLFQTRSGETGPGLNPFFGTPDNEVAAMGNLVWSGATAVNPRTGALEPQLLEALPELVDREPVAEQGVSMMFNIRSDARWEDGTPVTASDFARTHELIMDPDLAIRPDWRALHSIVGELVPTADDKRFVVTMPQADFRSAYLFPVVVPSHTVAHSDFTTLWSERFWLSSGPFRFVSHSTDAPAYLEPDEYYFERNGRYWATDPDTGVQLPHLDSVTFKFYSTDETGTPKSLDEITSGNADLHLRASSDQIATLKGPDGSTLEIHESPSLIWEHIDFQFADSRFDTNAESLVHSIDFRRAIAQSLDKNTIADLSGGVAVDSIVGIYLPNLDSSPWLEHGYDQNAAAEAVAALVPQPPTLIYSTTTGDSTIRIAEEVIRQLREVGIDAQGDYGPFLSTALPAGQYEIGAWRWIGKRGELELLRLLSFYDIGNPVDANFGSWTGANAEAYSQLLTEAIVTVDPEARAELWSEAESLLVQDIVLLPLVTRASGAGVAYRSDALVGISPQHGQGGETWGIENWRKLG